MTTSTSTRKPNRRTASARIASARIAPEALHDLSMLDYPEMLAITGFSREYLRQKGPKPVRLSPRCTRWIWRDVRAWIEARAAGSAS